MTYDYDLFVIGAGSGGVRAARVSSARGRTVTARVILIATGARPVVPDFPGKELGITSNEAFHLPDLPKRVVIAGAGYIANEFAGIFHNLGSHVTLVNRSDVILRGYDETVGDVTNRVQLTPVAIREGHAFADTVFGNKPTRVDYDNIPSAVFSHPPLAGVGMTEGQARNKLGSIKTYTSDFRAMKNVLAGRNERALYKLVVNSETDEIVGIHMIGPDAPEILQAAAIAIKGKLKKADFDQTVALHPTMAEELVLMR